MQIKPFLVEEWMNEYEVGAKYNIAETCVDSVSLDQLFALTGEDKGAFLGELCARRRPDQAAPFPLLEPDRTAHSQFPLPGIFR